jgi:glutaredoxin
MEKKLIIYVKEMCPYCIKLLELLDRSEVKYEKHDILKESEVVEKIITREGHTPVPQVEIGGKIIFDYDTEESLVTEIQKLL